MSLFESKKGIVLEGKHLFKEEITPVEAVIREGIVNLGTTLFPDRSQMKYLHRGFGSRGLGIYTLNFSDEVTYKGERFSVSVTPMTREGSRNVTLDVRVVLDGKDWNLDLLGPEDNTLIPMNNIVYLPKHWEREIIRNSDKAYADLMEFQRDYFYVLDEIVEELKHNMVVGEEQ